MQFTLIICTYKRAFSIERLLDSVQLQNVYPDEILIVDGSSDEETAEMIALKSYKNVSYFKVDATQRGLTKQRNFGISKVAKSSEIVCFLDDDTVLESNYFEEILLSFQNIKVIGVGGVAINENRWQIKKSDTKYDKYRYFEFENYVYPEALRNVLRNYLKLQSNLGPYKMPNFSHGRTCGFPLTGKTYEVDLLIGMSFSFRKSVFENIKFDAYFEGYGLYEDADFSLRAQNFGLNVINTNARLSHFHDSAGRPNLYNYGKMVVRNGWYVWRVKNPNPRFKDRFKWHAITLLLTLVRMTNVGSSQKKYEALSESLGRITGWFSLIFNKPKYKV